MKKLMTLFIILVMLGTCSTSYGMFLIYKASCSVKGVDDVSGLSVKVPLKGYLVLGFSDEGAFQDANLIIYGKKADGSKVYLQLNYSDSNSFLNIGMVGVGNYPNSYFVIGITCYGEDNPYEFESYVMGKMKPRDIGFGTTDLWLVSSSLKGVFTSWYDMLLDKDQDIYGSGSMSMKLDDSMTKLFNSQPRAQAKAVSDIIDILQHGGYLPGTAVVRVRQSEVLSADSFINKLIKK
jgi:hypothetical protein